MESYIYIQDQDWQNSSLGWLVNKVIDERRQTSTNKINSQVMKIECQRSEEKLM